MKNGRIADRLEALKRYAGYLKDYRRASLSQLQQDHTLAGAVCHYMQLAIECMMDIGEIIISERGLRKPQDGRDVFHILAEGKILPKKFAYYLAPVAGFRNILVHQYLKVDMSIVHERLQKDLKDFDAFARHIAKAVKL